MPLKHLLLSWLMYFAFTHSPAVFWKEEMWTWSHSACSGFLCTALTVVGVKKSGGRQESTVPLNWSWNLSSCQFFCNPIRKHFLFKLPCSFYFSCWIYNVPKWFANVLLLWEGLTPCHHYLWNWAFTESKDFDWNLWIKEAEDWLLHTISLKLKIENEHWGQFLVSLTLCHWWLFSQEREDLEGSRMCYLVDIYLCGVSFLLFSSYSLFHLPDLL